LVEENEDEQMKLFLNDYMNAKINWRNETILKILTTLAVGTKPKVKLQQDKQYSV
jgi:GH35 family endo-1,4-beta-xylanase